MDVALVSLERHQSHIHEGATGGGADGALALLAVIVRSPENRAQCRQLLLLSFRNVHVNNRWR
jgi:hypothetical protein